jgi:hypothetical protein
MGEIKYKKIQYLARNNINFRGLEGKWPFRASVELKRFSSFWKGHGGSRVGKGRVG